MTNPFDQDFYKFLIGFVCILALTFVVLYVANSYNIQNAAPAALEIAE